MGRFEVRSLASGALLGYVHADSIHEAWDTALAQYSVLFTLNSIGNPMERVA